jgi:hypothetical protein
MTPDRRIGHNIVVPPAEAAPDTAPIHPATPALGGLAGRIQAKHDRRDDQLDDDAKFFKHIGEVNLDPVESPTTVDEPYDPLQALLKSHAPAAAKKYAETKPKPEIVEHVENPRSFLQEQAAIQANRTRDRVKEHRQRQAKYASLYDDTAGPGVLRDKRAVETYTEEERMMPGAKHSIKKAHRYVRFLDKMSDWRMGGLRTRAEERSMAHEFIKAKRDREAVKTEAKLGLARLLPKRIRNREPGPRLPRR